MRALVVFESMFGRTRTIAEAIGSGLTATHEVLVAHVGAVTAEMVTDSDLLVVGGPTHVHGLSSDMSRSGVPETAEKSGGALELDPDHDLGDLRHWFTTIPERSGPSAAFDTRVDGPVLFTGHACKGIGSRLTRHGYRLVVDPESFLVDKQTQLLPGEEERAKAWGSRVGAAASSSA
jgi:hypothetical protein